MAPHFSILAWEIPWTEELGGLNSMGCKRVGHDFVTKQQPDTCPGVGLLGHMATLVF